jgi:Uma2 family endonuclease
LDEFARILALSENRDRLLELIDGEIVEKLPTERHGEVVFGIGSPLREYVKKHGLGRVSTEARHQASDYSFLPDVSFIPGDRLSVEEGSIPRMPDLAIEIQSPDVSLKKLREKADYYLSNGSRMVLIVNYKKRAITMITPDVEDLFLDGEMLDLNEVVPGFRIPVAEIFE